MVGLDLAKQVFQVHATTSDGICLRRDRLSRVAVLPYFEQLPAKLAPLEACARTWRTKEAGKDRTTAMLRTIPDAGIGR